MASVQRRGGKRRSTQAGAGRRRGKHRFPDKPGGECGPVIVTRADGTTEVQQPLSGDELRSVVRRGK